jgi:hypothetical protein
MSAQPLDIPDLREVMEQVGIIQEQVRNLIARQESTERALTQGMAGDLDRVLSVAETASSIGKAPTTLRHWLADAQLFDRHQLAVLFRKDVSNRWTSSPRLVAKWRQVALRQLQEACR